VSVIVNDLETKVYEKMKGQPQGAAASCALFNLFTDAASTLISNPASTFFADDGTSLANSIEPYRMPLQVANDWANSVGMRFNCRVVLGPGFAFPAESLNAHFHERSTFKPQKLYRPAHT
jgi:hypothetical protein